MAAFLPPQSRHLGMFIHFNVTLSLIKTFLELLFWNCLQSLRNILLNIVRFLWLHKKKEKKRGGGECMCFRYSLTILLP